MEIILLLSFFIGLGYIFGKLATKIGLPTVSGYLIAGLLIGIFNNYIIDLGISESTKVLDIISQITLSFIAFGIGSEFLIPKLKESGKKVFIITLFEVFGAILVVFLIMYFIVPFTNLKSFTPTERLSFSLVIATMSAATAPAATILVIRQFRTKGPITNTILPVAALDDVLGIIAFGLVLPIARIMTPIAGSIPVKLTFWTMIKGPLIEVFGSLAVGAALGFFLSLFTKEHEPKDEIQVKTIFFVLISLGVSFVLNLSPLLVSIAVGTVLVNLRSYANRSFRVISDFLPVFYILFFAIAGATLDVRILVTVGIIGVFYVIARGVGKIGGSYLGSVVAKADDNVKKYLGLALLPQGGISIGLSLLVRQYLSDVVSEPIITIILFSILIYESMGPIFAKIALQKGGELYQLDLETENG